MMLPLLILIFFTGMDTPQHPIELDITFGVYINDHSTKTFTARERHWILTGNQLVYTIDAHNTRYGDTLELTDPEMDQIFRLIKKNKLLKPVDIDLKLPYANKFGVTQSLFGTIEMGGETAKVQIGAEGYRQIEEDKVGKRWKELEYLFYDLIERHR